jgi:hypothetical protein
VRGRTITVTLYVISLYLYLGVARSDADLNTFLGGCHNGWGFIGEQAIYHNRENLKGYGESFLAGDIIGVYLGIAIISNVLVIPITAIIINISLFMLLIPSLSSNL